MGPTLGPRARRISRIGIEFVMSEHTNDRSEMASYLGRSEREVDRRIDRLREAWGPAELRRETELNDPAYFEHGLEILERGVIGGAGAWVSDADDRVLFIRHPSAPDQWGLPAGGHEPGETLAETARREVFEETCIECELTGLAFMERKRFVHEDDPQRRAYLLSVFFEGRKVGGEVRLDPSRWEDEEEILEARWFASPPESVHEWFVDLVAEWDWPEG